MNIRLLSLIVILFDVGNRVMAQGIFETLEFRGRITHAIEPSSPDGRFLFRFTLYTSRLSTTPTGLYYPTGAYTFDGGPNGSASSYGSLVYVANDLPMPGGGFADGIIFTTDSDLTAPTGKLFDGFANGVTLVSRSDAPSLTPFADTSFPRALDLSKFSERSATFYFQGGIFVRGEIDQVFHDGVLISQIPEPTPASIAMCGCLVWFFHSARKRSWNFRACLLTPWKFAQNLQDTDMG